MSKISEFITVSSPALTALIPIVELPVIQGNPSVNKKISLSDIKTKLFTSATDTAYGAVKVGATLTINGSGVLNVATSIPTQTGNDGKFLSTNGASLSWESVTSNSGVTVITPDDTEIPNITTLVFIGSGVTASSVGNAVTLDISGGTSSTGDFIFAAGDASLLPGATLSLSTYESSGNKESKLTLAPTGDSALDVGGGLRVRTFYGTGFEKSWTFNTDGSITFPDATTQTSAYPGVLVPANGDTVSGTANLVFYDGTWNNTSKVGINPATGFLTLTGTGGTGGIILPNSATISAVDIGFSFVSPSNGPGGVAVQENSLTVGIANPTVIASLVADPTNHLISFNGGPNDVVIAGITGPQGGTNVYTITGTWPANSTGFPITITSNNYVAGVTEIVSNNGVIIETSGGSWDFGLDGALTLPDASVIASYKPVTVIAATTTAQTITDNSSAAFIQFVETVDTAGAFSPGTFTAPYTGYYQINMSVYFSTTVSLTSTSFLLIDTNLDFTKQVRIIDGNWTGSYLHYSTVISATAGDAIRVAFRQVSGGDVEISSGSRLTIHRVSIS